MPHHPEFCSMPLCFGSFGCFCVIFGGHTIDLMLCPHCIWAGGTYQLVCGWRQVSALITQYYFLKKWYIYTLKFYLLAIEKNQIMTFPRQWTEGEIIVFIKINQTEVHVFSHFQFLDFNFYIMIYMWEMQVITVLTPLTSVALSSSLCLSITFDHWINGIPIRFPTGKTTFSKYFVCHTSL